MKTIIVTGGARGIGEGISREAAKQGYTVIINYNKSKKAAEALTEELKAGGFNAFNYKADVSDFNEVKGLAEFVIKKFGRIDVLVNNAGVALRKLITETTPQEFDYVFNTNIKGVFNCCKAVLPHMISAKSGNIINISSVFGITGASFESVYSASKGAVIAFTKALAKEAGSSNIRVNCIAPGVIDTDMNKGLDVNTLKEMCCLNKIGSVSDVAKLVLFLAGGESRFITGQVINCDGGLI